MLHPVSLSLLSGIKCLQNIISTLHNNKGTYKLNYANYEPTILFINNNFTSNELNIINKNKNKTF